MSEWRIEIKTALLMFGHILVALFGTLIVQAPFERLMVTNSIRNSLFRVDLLTCVAAFVLGLAVCSRSKFRGAKWIWVFGVCWFMSKVVFGPDGRHIVLWEVEATRLWSYTDMQALANWTLYTLFSLRLVMYSLGAWTAFGVNSRFDVEERQ